jgi:hypothetical protein
VIAVGALALGAPAASATVLYVSSSNPLATDGSNDCTGSAVPCRTIFAGIDRSAPGDVVQVDAGTYDEHVNVNRRVHLVGKQAGVDARTRSGTSGESIVTQGFEMNADGASVDGFLDDDNGTTIPGVQMSAASSGYRFVNNIVRDYTGGLLLGTNGVSQTVIRHNAFIDNNATGIGQGIAIRGWTDYSNVVVDANSMSGHLLNSVQLPATYSPDISITGNTSTGDGPMDLQGLNGGAITGNTINGASGGPGISLSGGNVGLDIRGNVVTGSAGSGVQVSDTSVQGNPNRGISVTGNDLRANAADGISVLSGGMSGTLAAHFNRIVGNTLGGISNGGTDPVDAVNNWWGCNAGPNQPSCGTTAGSGPTNANPWLVFNVTAERARVLTNGDTNRITAGFSFNSAPAPVDASQFPATPVPFPSATLGTVSPTSTTTSGGVAQTLFTAGGTAGQGNVTASADGQQVTTSNFEVSSQAGPQGNPGTNGTNGTNGQDGATGPQGPVGPQGPAGPEGPAGPSTPSSPAQPNPVLILSNSLRATKNRIVSVSINCPLAAGLCDGRLGIGVGNLTLGNTAFLVNGGNRAVIRLRGGAGVIRTAIKKKKVTVVVLSRDNAGTAALTTKVVKFRK